MSIQIAPSEFTRDYRQTQEDIKANGLKVMPLRVYLDRYRKLPEMRSDFPEYYFKFFDMSDYLRESTAKHYGPLPKRKMERHLAYMPQWGNEMHRILTEDITQVKLQVVYTGPLSAEHLKVMRETFLSFMLGDIVLSAGEDTEYTAHVTDMGNTGAFTAFELHFQTPWSQRNSKQRDELLRLIAAITRGCRSSSAEWLARIDDPINNRAYPRRQFASYLIVGRDDYYTDEPRILGGYENLDAAIDASKLLGTSRRWHSLFLIETDPTLAVEAY